MTLYCRLNLVDISKPLPNFTQLCTQCIFVTSVTEKYGYVNIVCTTYFSVFLYSLIRALRLLLTSRPAVSLAGRSSPTRSGLTCFGHHTTRTWLWWNGGKAWSWAKLVCLNRGVRHLGLEALQGGKGCRRPRCGHQPVPRTRPRVESPLRADTRMQLPQRSRISSCGHFRFP